ncbi:uncharacterized protein MONBRDRAFT_8488 [Monosiga brevicollis MX1]|uniref:GDP-mannose 4,6 dehydratase n=1 Tax=Monosiga brevicollis TaxID=81824 RepID=A9V067_MONBE|nr:uncharacterized protein MONBRDRAFT_8488 [Monosiga brevicollis MX1]EDQ89104.1 predicted protein [Monosiga brevicollis MX1]|eukprot:XP_001746209.1 hypothetical protein [Monosiga brevicollis MX1]
MAETAAKKAKSDRKVALITGITGQDGSYLAELLIEKGYTSSSRPLSLCLVNGFCFVAAVQVHGIIRRSSSFNTGRIAHLFANPVTHEQNKMVLHYGDLTDSTNLVKIVMEVQPTEVYNLGAMSHVKVSFDMAEYTGNVDGLGTLRLLDALRTSGLGDSVRFYQASTSELYGKVQEIPQTEKTPFYPRSPYGVAKLYGYWIVVNYRESYGMHCNNGILFNHESPRRGAFCWPPSRLLPCHLRLVASRRRLHLIMDGRNLPVGETFVTRKITRAVAKIHLGQQESVTLGNLDASRDWGHAKDYVEMMWLMLQQDTPDDFVIATNEEHSVREFVEASFRHIGKEIVWEGEGVNEVGKEKDTGIVRVKISERYYRPAEVERLLGNPEKAKQKLGWTPKISFTELVTEMVEADIKLMRANPLA